MKDPQAARQLSLLAAVDDQSRCASASLKDSNSLQPLLIDELLFREVSNFPSFDEINHGELFALKLSNVTTSHTHSLHRFPAKFIPQIPRWALREFGGKSAHVLDPFMGSGTTLVEALQRPGTVDGVDIDPLARLISRSKTSLLSSDAIVNIANDLHAHWPDPAVQLMSPMPGIDNFGHWFTHNAWAQLQSLHSYILNIDCSEQERQFLLTVFSSILRLVSNADDQSQKTYVSGTLPKSPPDVKTTFWRNFHRAVRGLRELEESRDSCSTATVWDVGDACNLPLSSESIDLIVTSPPYLDSVDYMYNLMLEYFWLGPYLGINDRDQFNAMRRAPVGAKNPLSTDTHLPASLEGLVDFQKIHPSRRRATSSYFAQMAAHFEEAARTMRLGARYVFVIGNSQSTDGVLPVHDALIRLAADSGLKLEKAFGYRIRRHYMKFPRKGRGGIILIDWVVVLRKVDHPVDYPQELPLTWVKLRDSAVAN